MRVPRKTLLSSCVIARRDRQLRRLASSTGRFPDLRNNYWQLTSCQRDKGRRLVAIANSDEKFVERESRIEIHRIFPDRYVYNVYYLFDRTLITRYTLYSMKGDAKVPVIQVTRTNVRNFYYSIRDTRVAFSFCFSFFFFQTS